MASTIYPKPLPTDGAVLSFEDGNNLSTPITIDLNKTGANTFESTSVLWLTVRRKSGASGDQGLFVEHVDNLAGDKEDPRTRVEESTAIGATLSPGDQWSILISEYLTPMRISPAENIVKVINDPTGNLYLPVKLNPSDIAAAL